MDLSSIILSCNILQLFHHLLILTIEFFITGCSSFCSQTNKRKDDK